MLKRTLPLLIACLTAATAANAQYGGGGGGGGGHGGGGHGRSGGGGGEGRGSQSSSAAHAPAPKPFSEPEIVGVIKAVDPSGERITIAYEPVEALNWPAGTQPFEVSKSALLKDLTVGEKVRFTLEAQHIAAIRPF